MNTRAFWVRSRGGVVGVAGLVLLAAATWGGPAAGAGAPAPVSVPLGAAAADLAVSRDGSRIAVATADGVHVVTGAGEQVFHALAGSGVRAVAVDATGQRVAAGTVSGWVIILDAAGSIAGVAPAGVVPASAPVTAVSLSADGRFLVAGNADGGVWSFTVDALEGTGVLVRPFWSYHVGSPTLDVYVTPDGAWVNTVHPRFTFAFENTFAAAPGGLLLEETLEACLPPRPAGACWWHRLTGSGEFTLIAPARDTYDLFVGSTNGNVLGVQSPTLFFADGGFFRLTGDYPTAVSSSLDGRHIVVGTAGGDLHRVATRPLPNSDATVWTAPGSARLAHVALAHDTSAAVSADADGRVRWRAAADGTLTWTYDAGVPAVGLAFTPQGSLAGAFGDRLLLWLP